MKEMPNPMREALERRVHAFHHAAQVHADIRGQVCVGDGLLDRAGQLAEIFARAA